MAGKTQSPMVTQDVKVHFTVDLYFSDRLLSAFLYLSKSVSSHLLFSGFFERRDSVIFERYEMFASTLNEHFPFGHTFSEDVLEHYGYKKFAFHSLHLKIIQYYTDLKAN